MNMQEAFLALSKTVREGLDRLVQEPDGPIEAYSLEACFPPRALRLSHARNPLPSDPEWFKINFVLRGLQEDFSFYGRINFDVNANRQVRAVLYLGQAPRTQIAKWGTLESMIRGEVWTMQQSRARQIRQDQEKDEAKRRVLDSFPGVTFGSIKMVEGRYLGTIHLPTPKKDAVVDWSYRPGDPSVSVLGLRGELFEHVQGKFEEEVRDASAKRTRHAMEIARAFHGLTPE